MLKVLPIKEAKVPLIFVDVIKIHTGHVTKSMTFPIDIDIQGALLVKFPLHNLSGS